MNEKINPAKRLHRILVLIKTAAGQKRLKYCDALKIIFDLEEKNFKELFSYAVSIQELVEEVENLVKSQSDTNHQLYLKYFRRLRTIVYNTNLHYDITPGHITEEMLFSLEVISNDFSKYHDEDEISEDDINKLIEELEVYYKSVNNSNIDIELKKVLLELLMMIRESIHKYNISGAKGIQDAITMCYGRVITLFGTNAENVKTCKEIGFIDYIRHIDICAGAALKIKALMGDLLKLEP